ncbi:MAG TPA: glycosyltransferase family 2 protein [Gemmatimonadaceae bacterium]|nr:glycosyltransferase family 2 protein [Gemmatimonadaceae bacterium]
MTLWPVLAALPWIAQPLVILWRLRGSRTLDAESDNTPAGAPRVSVIVPARNEARNIGDCLRSILASTYPSLEVVVVDDRSEDATQRIACDIARDDRRLRVIASRPLPPGWFGKQWACTQGAAAAGGELLLFTDADTRHAPDLIARSVNAMQARGAQLLSVVGRQELGSFWERVMQPQVFSMLLARYGGTETVNRSPRPADKIANGQCIFLRREAYGAIGGHEAVRDKVAEDLALAQRACALGLRTELIFGRAQLSTRMYTSLGELTRGWLKNIYAGGLDTLPAGAPARLLLPVLLLAAPVMMLAPPLALLAGALGLVGTGVTLWATICTAVMLAWWALVYTRVLALSPAYALAFPLGAAVLLTIIVRAIVRGRHVEWKGRAYRAK